MTRGTTATTARLPVNEMLRRVYWLWICRLVSWLNFDARRTASRHNGGARMVLTHLRLAGSRALSCAPSSSSSAFVARGVARATTFVGRRVASRRVVAMSSFAGANVGRDAAADAGAGGDGRGMMCCGRCAGEGVLVSLTKAQKRARKRARELARDGRPSRPPIHLGDADDDAPDAAAEARPSTPPEAPGKVLPCKACGGTGLVSTRDGELPVPRDDAPHVAVVGAGIGGAALALALQQRGVRVSVFERDAGFAARKQGYGLTMQKYSGGAALSQLGLVLEGVGSNANVSLAADGRELGRYGHSTLRGVARSEGAGAATSDGGRNVHLPRQALRRALLERLAPGTVRWGRRLVRFEERDGIVAATFEGEGEGGFDENENVADERFDLLVGADGIFSNVRRIKMGEGEGEVDPHPLRYLGVLVVLGICRGNDHPLCSHKVFQVVDGETRVYAMPFTASPDGDGCLASDSKDDTSRSDASTPPPGAMMWQLSFPVEESSAKALARDPAGLLAEAKRRCGDWPAPVPELLAATTTANLAGYPAYDRDCLDPERLRRPTDVVSRASRVTLVGDAAHPMSPFKGQGANQALLDAVQLARALARTERFEPSGTERRAGCARRFEGGAEGDDVAAALASFEATMCARSEEKVRRSRDAAAFLHSPAAMAEGNCVRAHAAAAAVEATEGREATEG